MESEARAMPRSERSERSTGFTMPIMGGRAWKPWQRDRDTTGTRPGRDTTGTRRMGIEKTYFFQGFSKFSARKLYETYHFTGTYGME